MSNLYTGEKVRALQRVMISAALASSLSLAAKASPPAPASVKEAVISLVADALSANLEFEGAGAVVSQRVAALDQARAQYLPALDLSARYTRADGGPAFYFSAGDPLHPVDV